MGDPLSLTGSIGDYRILRRLDPCGFTFGSDDSLASWSFGRLAGLCRLSELDNTPLFLLGTRPIIHSIALLRRSLGTGPRARAGQHRTSMQAGAHPEMFQG